jgi:hypothetical protein
VGSEQWTIRAQGSEGRPGTGEIWAILSQKQPFLDKSGGFLPKKRHIRVAF